MFTDRRDAGTQLGEALRETRGDRTPLVLGIPRGGVEVAYHVARILGGTLSLLVVRKLPFPDNPEAGFGAVAEGGRMYLVPDYSAGIRQALMNRIIEEQKAEVARRVETLRNGDPLPALDGRDVLLVDDGIAMGSTTQAAVLCCRQKGARHVAVAAPVASPAARTGLEAAADEVYTLLTPPFFRAVAAFYRNWYDVSDEEVADIVGQAREEGLWEAGTEAEEPSERPAESTQRLE